MTQLRDTVDEAAKTLAPLASECAGERFKLTALDYATRLQGLIDTGSSIVHGADETLGQDSIDALF